MQEIKAPDAARAEFKSLFIAGGISGCSDWQKEFITLLGDARITVFNPRRDIFPSERNAEEAQIRWEFERLRSADFVSFWFPAESLDPITLFELGSAMERSVPLAIGVHKNYARRSDIEIQAGIRRPEIKIAHSLEEFAERARTFFL
jgi:hypothetical protein